MIVKLGKLQLEHLRCRGHSGIPDLQIELSEAIILETRLQSTPNGTLWSTRLIGRQVCIFGWERIASWGTAHLFNIIFAMIK